MKVKYVLSEETLEKDIDQFIRTARKGAFVMDRKHDKEGLQILREYIRLIQQAFKEKDYKMCRACGKKLILFLFETTTEHDYFSYSYIIDLLAFKTLVTMYFSSLKELCDVDELFREYMEYISSAEDAPYAEEFILDKLSAEELARFEELLFKEAQTRKEDDYGRYSAIYFLLSLAKRRRNRTRYAELVDSYAGMLGDESGELMADYDNLGKDAYISI